MWFWYINTPIIILLKKLCCYYTAKLHRKVTYLGHISIKRNIVFSHFKKRPNPTFKTLSVNWSSYPTSTPCYNHARKKMSEIILTNFGQIPLHATLKVWSFNLVLFEWTRTYYIPPSRNKPKLGYLTYWTKK